MLLIKFAVGALVGAVYFWAVSGWKKSQSPLFKARRAAGWWGLISAELMILTLGYRDAHTGGGNDLLIDMVFGFSSWLLIGVPTSIVFGLATYIVVRVIKKPVSSTSEAQR